MLKNLLFKLNQQSQRVLFSLRSLPWTSFNFTLKLINNHFAFLNRIESNRRYQMIKAVVLCSLFSLAWFKAQSFAMVVNDSITRIQIQDPKMVKDASKRLDKVLERYVFKNKFIQNKLGDVLVGYVFQNERLQFVLSRQLSRVMTSPYINSQLVYLVKKPVLNRSVLYNDYVYDQFKGLIITQLRGQQFKNVVDSNLRAYLKSEHCKELAGKSMGDTFRLNGVRDAFVRGVVDNNIYTKLQNKQFAKSFDETVYSVLK